MKKMNFAIKLFSLLALAVLVLTISCSKEDETVIVSNEISEAFIKKLQDAHFDVEFAKAMTFRGEYGVAVEDMFFTFDQVDELQPTDDFTKHYRTTNLVTGLPRLITVSIDPALDTLGSNALDLMIDMYNSEGLELTFSRVPFGGKGRGAADIEVTEFYEMESGGYITLGRAAGFPTRKGDPASGFGINSRWFELSIAPDVARLAGTMAHEVGHCIGLRHTDYMTRESCGQNVNEGSARVGAIYIPGTPSVSDATSIMQSCGPAEIFNRNDVIALNYLY